MNKYEYQFVAVCPENGAFVSYSLVIFHEQTILVEHIKTACALHRTGYHEAIADDLYARFGGSQIMKADHHGVLITSLRGKP
jgi:hypothetical protein